MIRGGVGQGPVARGRPLPRRGPARPPSRPVQQEEHRQELEALRAQLEALRAQLEAVRAQLEAKRLRSQELQRRFADEAREMKKRAEEQRQLLAKQLRSKCEQERARELQRLWEQIQEQQAAEIRQLLCEGNTKWCQAQQLLQQQWDEAVRQVRDLQRQLFKVPVNRGRSGGSEARGKQQDVNRQLCWRADSKQAAQILDLQEKLQLRRKLPSQYIPEKAEGGAPASHNGDRAAAQHRLQSLLGTGATRPGSSKSSGASGAGGGEGQRTTCSSSEDAHLRGEGQSSRKSVRDIGVQVPEQQEACPPGSGDSPFLEQQKAQLQNALKDLARQWMVLQEETCFLKNESSLVEAREKAGRLKQELGMLGLLTKNLTEKTRKLKELAAKSGKTAAKTEQVDQQQRGQLETEAGKKLQLQKKLDQERSRLKNRYEELKVCLTEMRNEKARRAQETSQLRRQKERIEEIQSENAALKQKLVQATEQRNAAVGAAKRLQTLLKDLDCKLKAMSQPAERTQQQQQDHEETKLMLQKKEEEVKHWQRAWAELRRTREEELQASRVQLRESEQQYQHQCQQWELLSQQLEQEKRKESSPIVSELPQARTPPTAQAYAEQSHDLCSHEDSSDASEKAAKILGFYTSSSASDATRDGPGCCTVSDEGSVGGNGESGAEHVSFVPQSLGQESPKLQRLVAQQGHHPVEGPNERPEAELPHARGEYVHVSGDVDEHGGSVRERKPVRRRLFSPTSTEVSDSSQVTSSELCYPLQDSDIEISSCSRRGRKKQRQNKSF
ncbi:RIMS-binding protein 3-like [Anser cygnoides]|uniref:RIMS-binding protein 3-like n=1 Tax=Anser cygnoides TaxID=8845 RepID=UPI0034D29EB2